MWSFILVVFDLIFLVESLMVYSKNGRCTLSDRQTNRFHCYIIMRLIGAHIFVHLKIGRDTCTGRQTDRFHCYIVEGPIGGHMCV